MKRKYLLLVCLIGLLSCVTGVVRADSQTSTKPYLHKDVNLLSQHLRIKLLKAKEIGYTITYHIQVEEESVQNPILYFRMEEYTRNPLDEMIVTVNDSLITAPSPRDWKISCERWEEMQKLYTHIESLLLPDISYFCYLPVCLERGEHSIEVQYRMTPRVSYTGWDDDQYFYEVYLYSFPTEDLTIEILREEKKGLWRFEDKPLTENIKKKYRAGEQPGNYLEISVTVPNILW